MCGIFGWIPAPAFCRTHLPTVAEELCALLRHRGPDDWGYAVFDGAGRCTGDEKRRENGLGVCLLGQTRLSIIDLSAAGHQPMFSACGRYCIVYNGEIYNYRELRDALRALGREFRTETDTEVLLAAYAEWGRACLDRLNGMYAFAVYDTHAQRLFCARDCFAIKPFFWHLGENGFCFASEIPALLQIPGVPRMVDPQQVYNFLHFEHVEQGVHTMVKGVARLAPAHWMEVDVAAMRRAENSETRSRAVRQKRYWQVPLPPAASMSLSDAAAAVRETFLHSVRLHLRSDVPVGVALSGGIDSTAVACAVRHLEPDAELHTFSFVAADPALSEEAWIDIAMAGCEAEGHKTMPSALDMLADMDAMVLRQGEPVASTSIYAQYCVMRLARQHGVKVLLEGQGADELFAGYLGYLGERVETLLHRGEPQKAVDFLVAAAQWPGREKTALRLLAQFGLCAPPTEERGIDMARVLRVPALLEAGVALARPFPCAGVYHSDDRVRVLLAEHLTWKYVPGLMRHGDRNAMHFSIENRVPFCTRDMATLALSLPEEYLINNDGCNKMVLREALRGLVPDAILNRRDKIGFDAPGLPWLRSLLPWVLENFMRNESVFIDEKVLIQEWKAMLRNSGAFDWFYWRALSYLRWKQLLRLQETV